MMSSDNMFEPNKVEEQLEQLAHTETSLTTIPEARLMRDLECLSHQYMDSYQRVSERLSRHMKTQSSTLETPPGPSLDAGHYDELYQPGSFQASSSTTPTPVSTLYAGPAQRKQKHVIRPFMTIAAILILSLVTGSTLWFLSTVHSTHSITEKNNSVVRNTPTPAPLPASFQCPQLDAGFYYICSQKQYQLINQTHRLADGQQITLLLAYADTNQVHLEISASSPKPYANKPGEDTIITPLLTTQNNQDICDPSGDGSYSSNHKIRYMSLTCPFFTSFTPGKVLNLHLDVQVGVVDVPPTSVIFNFAVPVYSPMRILDKHQTLMVNSTSYTLDHIVVTSSMTRIFMVGTRFDTQFYRSIRPGTITLSVAGKTYNTPVAYTWTSAGKQSSVLGLEIDLAQPLYDQQGAWTLTIDKAVIPGATQNLVYHFTVPSAQ